MQNQCYLILNRGAVLAPVSPIALLDAILRFSLIQLALHDYLIISRRPTCADRSLRLSCPGTKRLALRFFEDHQILNQLCLGMSFLSSLFLVNVNPNIAS